MVFIENASPFKVQILKPCAAPFCLRMVNSILSSGVAGVPGLPKCM
jgi:hypothetical protein